METYLVNVQLLIRSLSMWHRHVINVLHINSLRKLIPANQLIASPSKPHSLHLIDTRNKNPTYACAGDFTFIDTYS